MRLHFVACALAPTGYGEFARLFIAALHEAGHELSVSLLSWAHEPAAHFGARGLLVASLVGRDFPSRQDATIICAPASQFEVYRRMEHPVGFTMCESETPPLADVAACNRVDRLVVPASHSQRVFAASGVTVPISVVHPPIETLSPGSPDGRATWTFLSVFDWDAPHKNPEALLSAYFREFRADEPVILRVKAATRGQGGDERIVRQVRELKTRLGQAGQHSFPKIEIKVGSMSSDDMEALYAAADVYVSPHRGEGWGLPIWEAMRRGLPVIATGYGGNMDFMTSANSIPLNFQIERGWAIAAEDELRAWMRWCFARQDDARALGRRGQADVEARFTPELSVRAFIDAIKRSG